MELHIHLINSLLLTYSDSSQYMVNLGLGELRCDLI